MAQIIGVRFKKVGKVYYFDPCGTQVAIGQNVIVETARGVEYGEVALANRDIAEGEVVKPLKKLIRVATPSDEKVVETNRKRAKEAFRICEQKIAEHKLDMKLVSVEYTFDLNKVLFYFTADGRVDFRELVKDLASVFRTRIELRQIGVRDEAKVLGGLGICGRPLCCASFLDDFQPVSINMAKQQNLSLNPAKISGTCGRLMCCLKYEQEVYEELGRVTPYPDSTVQTPDGVGVVTDASLLRGTCTVVLENDPGTPHCYRCQDCQILQAGRKQRRPQHAAKAAEVIDRTEKAAARPASPKPAASKPAAEPAPAPLNVPSPAPAARPEAPETEQAAAAPQRERRRTDRPRKPRRRPQQGGEQKRDGDKRPPRRETRGKNTEAERPRKERRPAENTGEFVDAHRQPRRRRPRRRPQSGEAKPSGAPENKA
ncbi:MAG TPA: stage 0 sporulation family protein [Candidatus Butyricicoccus stercorigallinarum]|nr:stage 0 sporulation family protein [Candidatus Butyricicoccus stercorigallinarum]